MDKKQYIEKFNKHFRNIFEGANKDSKSAWSSKAIDSMLKVIDVGLSECWDMAGEEIKVKATKLRLRHELDHPILPQVPMSKESRERYHNLSCAYCAGLSNLEIALTSQKEEGK